MMTQAWQTNWPRGNRPQLDPRQAPEYFDGVLGRRFGAFLIDVVILTVPVIVLTIAIFVFGIVTLGLGWALFFLLSPIAAVWAIAYYAFTLGGARSATLGMRVMEIRVRGWDGGPISPLFGALHAIGFWISVSFLTPLVLLVALFNARRQLLHDIVLGISVVNTDGRAQALRSSATPR